MHTQPNVQRRRHACQRGSAMTELLICVLPYGMVLLGVILLGELTLAKQEAIQAVSWTSPRPGVQDEGTIRQHFFQNNRGTATFEEEAPYEPEVSGTEEEPVLPYDTSGKDIEAGITRIASHVSQSVRIDENGEAQVTVRVNPTAEGNYLVERGIVSAINSEVFVNPDIDNLNLSFPIDNGIATDVSFALGEWLTYSRSSAQYSYKLDVGQARMPYEEEDGADRLRQEFTLGAGDQKDVYSYQSSTRNPEVNRGMHIPDVTNVDIDQLQDLPQAAISLPMPEPVNTALTFDPWDKDYGFTE